MSRIKKSYPGKSADQIYAKVDEVMQRMSTKMGLKYDKDPDAKTGKVSKMGVSGSYLAKDGEVTVELHFPMLVPGSMKKEVQENIERRLDELFA